MIMFSSINLVLLNKMEWLEMLRKASAHLSVVSWPCAVCVYVFVFSLTPDPIMEWA